ncbi:glutamic acid-rich protein-like [Nylanderia fulva]|uniref:glutamic acid-rich protein-like n=1 Tax=Nylanderia fulva TaxID=613905 RepID=UPI0010FB6F0A|nr:glutamic acid-rich protein-like [Nylanderia fulva]
MKTKVDKKGKKRSLSETSLSAKSTLKQENVIESKKSPKKAKLATSAQNGNSTTQNKVQILKKMYKQKEKQKTKQQINIGQPLITKKKTEIKLPIAKLKEESVSKKIKTKENKLENLKKKQAKREVHKKRRRRFLNAASTLSIEEMEAKIEEIRNREVLSKRAKKMLSALNRKLKYEKSANKLEKENSQHEEKNEAQNKIKEKKKYVHHQVKNELEMDDQDDSDDQDDNEDDKDENDEDHSDKEESIDNINEQFDDESEEDDESKDDEESEDDKEFEDDESEDDEDDIDEKANILKGKKEEVKERKKPVLEHQKKNENILFVGNLPSDWSPHELEQHFLTKVNKVAFIRRPTKGHVKKFAFVCLTNSTDLEKGLSLNQSLFKKEQIKVEVLKPNDKKMNKVKNFAIAKKNPQALKKAKKINLSQIQQKKKSIKKEK